MPTAQNLIETGSRSAVCGGLAPCVESKPAIPRPEPTHPCPVDFHSDARGPCAYANSRPPVAQNGCNAREDHHRKHISTEVRPSIGASPRQRDTSSSEPRRSTLCCAQLCAARGRRRGWLADMSHSLGCLNRCAGPSDHPSHPLLSEALANRIATWLFASAAHRCHGGVGKNTRSRSHHFGGRGGRRL